MRFEPGTHHSAKDIRFDLCCTPSVCFCSIGAGRAEDVCGSKGYIDVQKLTCAQLVNTFQEDADFLGIWYSGWYNGLGKKHAINVPRVKEGIHNVIVHCKDNKGKTVIQAIDFVLKEEQRRRAVEALWGLKTLFAPHGLLAIPRTEPGNADGGYR